MYMKLPGSSSNIYESCYLTFLLHRIILIDFQYYENYS